MSTKVDEFFSDLDAGVFEDKLSKILSDVAGATIDHGQKGEVVIKLSMKQVGNSDQVAIDHTIQYKRPTSRGHVSEVNTTTTPMYVGKRGAMSFLPENQGQLLDKKGNPAEDDVAQFPVNTRKH